jgi:uncharacterized cupin superfamily protein
MAVSEAPLRSTRFGLAPDGEGWFVINAAETRWRDYGPLSVACDFEGNRPFKQLGININVLDPGEPLAMYHHEAHEEGFLVLAGECLLIVEGRERSLTAWDFFHCPGGTAHAIVGAGDGPAVVLAVGARGGRKGIVYLAELVALDRGTGVDRQTTKSAEAYAPFPRAKRRLYHAGWLPRF